MKAKLYSKREGSQVTYRVPLEVVLDTFLRPEDRAGRDEWYAHTDDDEDGTKYLELSSHTSPPEVYFDQDGNAIPEPVRKKREIGARLTTRETAREIAREVVREALGADGIAKPTEP